MSEEIMLAPIKPRGRKPKAQSIEPNDDNASSINTVRQAVSLPQWETRLCEINIVGKTPLIVHNWSEKAVRMMLDKQTGKASSGREKKDPWKDFVGSLYPIPGEKFAFGVPAPAFKAAAVSAANDVELKMTTMRRAFHVDFYTVPILAEPITKPATEWDVKYAEQIVPYHKLGISMRMDIVRLESGVADIRFRAWWPKWKTKLRVEYNPKLISLEQLLNLFRAAGDGGVAEWRPSAPQCRSGEYGRFTVE